MSEEKSMFDPPESFEVVMKLSSKSEVFIALFATLSFAATQGSLGSGVGIGVGVEVGVGVGVDSGINVVVEVGADIDPESGTGAEPESCADEDS